MNAHIIYDLPQALAAVITDEQFDDAVADRPAGGHRRAIDDVLASWVAAEDDQLTRLSAPAPLLRPFNRLGTQRFLREAPAKVRANALALSRRRPTVLRVSAKSRGPGARSCAGDREVIWRPLGAGRRSQLVAYLSSPAAWSSSSDMAIR
jgi:Family of unknown function (DUF5995)